MDVQGFDGATHLPARPESATQWSNNCGLSRARSCLPRSQVRTVAMNIWDTQCNGTWLIVIIRTCLSVLRRLQDWPCQVLGYSEPGIAECEAGVPNNAPRYSVRNYHNDENNRTDHAIGNYMYHPFQHSQTLHFAHSLYLHGSIVVKALCYKPEGSGFEALGFTQPLTEMSTRSIKIMFLGSKAAAGA
jgi:hypothetical protein